MKTILNENFIRIFEKVNKINLNEANAYNSAGEPNMTHSQFNQHSEPSEPDFDDQYDHDVYPTPKSIFKALEQHFNTIIIPYRGSADMFLKNEPNQKIQQYYLELDYNRGFTATFSNGDDHKTIYSSNSIDDVDIDALIKAIEPYKHLIISGEEAKKAADWEMKSRAADSAYARQERSAMGGY